LFAPAHDRARARWLLRPGNRLGLFRKRDTCRLCHSNRQELVVPMAGMPIGTPNFEVPDAGVDDPVFRTAVPLECRDCGDLHILHVGNPEIQYRHYVYTTSISLGLREHFATYADDVIQRQRR
jgi:hypothetical protein